MNHEDLYIIECKGWSPEQKQNLLKILQGHGIKAIDNEWYGTIEVWE